MLAELRLRLGALALIGLLVLLPLLSVAEARCYRSTDSGQECEALSKVTNPTSILTRPADTAPYAQNDLIASNTAAGSVVVPFFNIPNAAGAVIPRVRLFTNVTTGWDAATIRVRLFAGPAPPTYTNGDNGAYVRATGTPTLIGRFDMTLVQAADGAQGIGLPIEGNAAMVKLASGTAIYWDLQTIGAAALTPIASQTFTLTPEILQ